MGEQTCRNLFACEEDYFTGTARTTCDGAGKIFICSAVLLQEDCFPKAARTRRTTSQAQPGPRVMEQVRSLTVQLCFCFPN
jgi:hypothetical protein